MSKELNYNDDSANGDVQQSYKLIKKQQKILDLKSTTSKLNFKEELNI